MPMPMPMPGSHGGGSPVVEPLPPPVVPLTWPVVPDVVSLPVLPVEPEVVPAEVVAVSEVAIVMPFDAEPELESVAFMPVVGTVVELLDDVSSVSCEEVSDALSVVRPVSPHAPSPSTIEIASHPLPLRESMRPIIAEAPA